MLVIEYVPKEGKSDSWNLDTLDALTSDEAEAIEFVVGGGVWRSFGQWVGLFYEGNFRAWRALLWTLLRRTDPDLDFDQLKLRVSELQVHFDSDGESVVEGKSETSDEATDSA